MSLIYTHDVLDELVRLLSLPRQIVDISSQITITLAVGDCVRVTYETCPENISSEESDV